MSTDFEKKKLSAASYRFAIVRSRWNEVITRSLADGAKRALNEAGAGTVEIFEVPGAFELPAASMKLAETGLYEAVIALGVVVRGDTPHFDYVAGQAASGLMQASLDTGVPVMFGVITADNMQQALDRSGPGDDNKGYEAAVSAIEMAVLFDAIDRRSSELAAQAI